MLYAIRNERDYSSAELRLLLCIPTVTPLLPQCGQRILCHEHTTWRSSTYTTAATKPAAIAFAKPTPAPAASAIAKAACASAAA